MEQAVTERRGSHLTTLHLSIFLVSFPFGIIAFVLPIYSDRWAPPPWKSAASSLPSPWLPSSCAP